MSPKNTTTSGFLRKAARQFFRRFRSTSSWVKYVKKGARSGYERWSRIWGSATKRMWDSGGIWAEVAYTQVQFVGAVRIIAWAYGEAGVWPFTGLYGMKEHSKFTPQDYCYPECSKSIYHKTVGHKHETRAVEHSGQAQLNMRSIAGNRAHSHSPTYWCNKISRSSVSTPFENPANRCCCSCRLKQDCQIFC